MIVTRIASIEIAHPTIDIMDNASWWSVLYKKIMEVLNIEDFRYNGQCFMVVRTLQVNYGSVKHRRI